VYVGVTLTHQGQGQGQGHGPFEVPTIAHNDRYHYSSKLVMYEFYYDCLLPKFGDRLHLCFTDTDNFICDVESEDLVADLRSISDLLDTSNFDRDHPLFSEANRRTLEKFKSETADVPPTEFCGLRSKMYSLATLDGSRSFLKANGVP